MSPPRRPIVFVTLPTCPACHGRELHVYGTVRSEGGLTRYTQCRRCFEKFIVIAEYDHAAGESDEVDAELFRRVESAKRGQLQPPACAIPSPS